MKFHDPERLLLTCYGIISSGLLYGDEVEKGELAPFGGEWGRERYRISRQGLKSSLEFQKEL